ncbi:MAG: septation protein SpoVG family protein [Elusimicrobiota bacterium]|nr:septation protein SpoVG family protein [Elusimicrobiota bacterium]
MKRITKNITIVLGITIFTAATLFAGDISVTSVKRDGRITTVVINNVIEITDIKIEKGKVVLPYYELSSGNIYPQVEFLTDEARKVVEDAVLNNTKTPKTVKQISYKITEMEPSGSDSSVKAYAAVSFNNAVEIQAKVMESSYNKGKYWVGWPARAPKGKEEKWKNQVKILNAKVKRIVENDLIKKFEEGGASGSKATDVDVTVLNETISEPLTVTAVEVKDRKDAQGLVGIASIDLNYSFRINDIKVYSRLGQTLVELPKYVSNSGNEYDQIRIFDSKLRQRIKDAIENRTPSSSKSSRIGYKITNFEKNQWGGAVKFDGAVTINDAAEIQFRVIDGKSYNAFVAWPSVKEQGEYVDKIFPVNKKVKEVINGAILTHYYREK